MEFLQHNWYWATLAGISGGVLVLDLVRGQNDNSQLSPVQATLLINREDALVLDIRNQGEYAQGHIPNARHIPAGDFERRIGELVKLKSRPVIVCCASGARTKPVIEALRKGGFDKVFNIRGGIFEWEKAGYPVSRKGKSK